MTTELHEGLDDCRLICKGVEVLLYHKVVIIQG